MRTIYSQDLIPHLWARQAQPMARCRLGYMHFRGDTLYSHDTPALPDEPRPIATHVKHRGRSAVLVTSKKHSKRAVQHVKLVRRAVAGEHTVFGVNDLRAAPAEQLPYYAAKIATTFLKAVVPRRRSRPSLADVKKIVDEANAFAKFFDLAKRFKLPQNDKAAQQWCAWATERISRCEVKALARQRKREARQAKEEKKQRDLDAKPDRANLRAWRAGTHQQPLLKLPHIYLRVAQSDSGLLETSRGGQVSVKAALKLLPLIRSGKPYAGKCCGTVLCASGFRIKSIDQEGNLKAGCGTVTRAEIERIAKILGA